MRVVNSLDLMLNSSQIQCLHLKIVSLVKSVIQLIGIKQPT